MDDALERYIARALELADQRQGELDEQDLAEIARDLGLTDEDLARVEQAIADHLDRGRGYSDHGMWDDAIREFEEASAIAPSRAEVRLALAHALTERWAATDFPDDKRRAEELARAVVDRQPNNKQAYTLLARLSPTDAPKPPPTATDPAQPAASSSSRPVILITALLMLIAGATSGVILHLASTGVEQPHVTVKTVATTDEFEPRPVETGEIDLPVEHVPTEGLAFTTRRSRLARYPEKAFYTLWGEFEVTDDAEFEEIEISVKLRDDGGDVLTHETRKAWASHEATLRKGDHAVFTMLVESDREAKSVVLDVVRAERQTAKGPYAEAAVVTPKATVEIPEHLKLEIRERTAGFDPMMDGPKGFFEASWEFANVGDVPIRELTYTITIFDENDEELATKKKLAAFASNPAIRPGDVFLESTIEMLDRPSKRYELTITELE